MEENNYLKLIYIILAQTCKKYINNIFPYDYGRVAGLRLIYLKLKKKVNKTKQNRL